jgi:hypothetical protein
MFVDISEIIKVGRDGLGRYHGWADADNFFQR